LFSKTFTGINAKQSKIHAGMYKTHHFERKNAKIFWGGDTSSTYLIPFGACGSSIFSPTALNLNVTPPQKKKIF